MATDATKEEFVTIVPVGEPRPATRDPAFVTVLTVGAATGAADVVVRRPRGARLGLGLKFEGGSAAAEKVRRLLVQSCAEDSPAAKATAPWGKLIPGDEILAIDGISVAELTRIDCVRRLKDSDENLKLQVRHFESVNGDDKTVDTTDSPSEILHHSTLPPLPPPVPPRKLGKKNSFKDKQSTQFIGDQIEKDKMTMQQVLLTNNLNNKLSRKSSFDSHLHRQNKESIAYLKKGSPEEVRRLVRRLSDGKTMPPEAEVYIDLLSNEWERCLALADAESDDTGSSISTVVDKLSSMASSVENSIPSTPIMQPKTIDIQKVLNCIENIDTSLLNDINNKSFLERPINNIISEVLTKEINERIIHAKENVSNLIEIDEFTIKEKNEIKKIPNDANNNTTTQIHNITLVNLRNEENNKENSDFNKKEKPTPMPRNVKTERESESKANVVTEIPNVTSDLLTPTKKNCIESWLMHSEAEMKNKNEEKVTTEVVAANVPEVLPRLIDFVPKPQYKEYKSSEPVVMPRPTTAPPPPPVETREDGSGASLDTIGELDETADISLTDKSISTSTSGENKAAARKLSCGADFWEDRINKSDPEDKSLSNDESPLPTCPRQPPDGVETPSEVIEKVPESPISRIPPKLPSGWPTARSRLSYSRKQDARSEASVKDKIAMFSNDRGTSTDQLDKCGTLPARNKPPVTKVSSNSYLDNYKEVKSLDRRLTKSQDNLDDVPRSHKRPGERPEVLGGQEIPIYNSVLLNRNTECSYNDNKPLFYGSTNALNSNKNTNFIQPVYHSRSNSDDSNKSSHKLEYLIEQRKKSTSKLRALMIPETQVPLVDLPEIKVDNHLASVFTLDNNSKTKQHNKTDQSKKSISKSIDLKDAWKNNTLPNNIPKYSPAFKRKSLQVYTSGTLLKENLPQYNEINNYSTGHKNLNRLVPLKPPRQSLDIKLLSEKSPPYDATTNFITSSMKKSYNKYESMSDTRDFRNMEIKICTITDVVDSDNDSAMSSTQSSYRSSASSPLHTMDSIESDSSHLSPRITHFATYTTIKTESPPKNVSTKISNDYEKRNVCRSMSSDTNVSLSSSAGSAATSGSQASCSSLDSTIADSDKKKVSKVYDIDTINRKNILASAKCRSGRDTKLNSPVIEAKFTHDTNYERCPAPPIMTPDCFSTLPSNVSAITNKVEGRRRNKVIAASDSDTDNELTIRQRKAEYKNARLKRNSSSSNKNKQNESSLDTSKNIEEAPKVISDRIIKEIKKAGLDNYDSNKPNVPVSKVNETKLKKERVNVTTTIERKSLAPKISGSVVNKPVIDKLITNGVQKSDTAQDECDGAEVPKYSTHMVRLQKGAGTGVGLILAGGIDCEAKEVTVHRVLTDSIANRAGLIRGARIRSINGYAMAGLTHAQSVAILKEKRSEIVIEIEDDIQKSELQTICGSANESKARLKDDVAVSQKPAKDKAKNGELISVVLKKTGKAGGTGLGFSLEGGRDSLDGGRPLTIKKLFQGAVAEENGNVRVGAELLSAAGQTLEGYTRFQAWDYLKSLPVGPVSLVLRNPAS